MYLHEYQSKAYFARFGIPTVQGKTAASVAEAVQIAAEFGLPVVVNAQSFADQRFFRLANTLTEAEHIARDILAMILHGVRVQTLLIEPAADVAAEYFLGFYADRGNRLLMVASNSSALGQVGRNHAAMPVREEINPFLGILDFQARSLANSINLPREHWDSFRQIARNLYHCCDACDALHAEINPLALTRSSDLIALGGRLVIDDNALFRQGEIAALRDVNAEPSSVALARNAGISHVRLNGTVGCIFSGAGLGMATLDLLARHALSACDFVDLCGELRQDRISAALRLLSPDARIILFNLFADKIRCPEAARELTAALAEVRPTTPLVIRLAGQNAEEGLALLQSSGLVAFTTTEAVRLAAEIAKGIHDVHSGG